MLWPTFYAGIDEILNLVSSQEQMIVQPHADIRLVDGVTSCPNPNHHSSVRAIADTSGVLMDAL